MVADSFGADMIEQFVDLPDEQIKEIESRLKSYVGLTTVLESAIGALIIGKLYGWRVLRMVHSNKVYNQYEDILGIKFQDACPEYTELSDRNMGIHLAKKFGGFWKVFKGEVPSEGKGNLI